MLVGIFWSVTLTKPPTVPALYNRVEGPRMISICLAKIGSTVTAWSGDKLETSAVSEACCKTFTRGPSWPRITGRLEPEPYWFEYTPSSSAKASPMVGARSFKLFCSITWSATAKSAAVWTSGCAWLVNVSSCCVVVSSAKTAGATTAKIESVIKFLWKAMELTQAYNFWILL